MFSWLKRVIDENEKEHRRMLELTDPEDTVEVPIYNRDFLLQFDHLIVFEDILHKYHIKIESFKNIESELNGLFRQVSETLEDEVKTDHIPLYYDNGVLALTKEFTGVPFYYYLYQHGLEIETRLSAIEAKFYNKEHLTKTTTLNNFKEDGLPFFVADSHPVMPSDLTLLLKYAIKYLDTSGMTVDENSEFMLWKRDFQTMALMLDFIRQHKDYRSQVVDIIVNHCNDYYKIPKDIAAALCAHMAEQNTPYHSSEFKIRLNFIPDSVQVDTVSGSLTVFYF